MKNQKGQSSKYLIYKNKERRKREENPPFFLFDVPEYCPNFNPYFFILFFILKGKKEKGGRQFRGLPQPVMQGTGRGEGWYGVISNLT